METAYIQVLDVNDQPVTELFRAENAFSVDHGWHNRTYQISFRVQDPSDELIRDIMPSWDHPIVRRKLVVKDRVETNTYTIIKNAFLQNVNVGPDDYEVMNAVNNWLNCTWVYSERYLILDGGDEIRVETRQELPEFPEELFVLGRREGRPLRERVQEIEPVNRRRPGEATRHAAPSRPDVNKVIWLTDGF